MTSVKSNFSKESVEAAKVLRLQHCVHMSHPSCDDALLWRVEYDFC